MAENIRLNRREFDLLDAIAAGLTNRAIADRRERHENTIEREVSALYAKLGVSGRVAAVRWYTEHFPQEALNLPAGTGRQPAFGALLHELRERVFKDQLQWLADCLERVLDNDIPVATLETFERGDGYPTVQMVRALETCLGVEEDPMLTIAYVFDLNSAISRALSRRVVSAAGE